MVKEFLQKHRTIKKYLLPILTAVFFIVAISGVFIVGNSRNTDDELPPRSTKQTDTLVDTTGKQVIEMTVRGDGYSPNELTAKPNEPIVLRTNATNAFGCASIVMIPSLKIRKDLPINGKTDIEIPAQTAGTILKGTCIMGMYSFDIRII